jgi:hypothetical protein
MTPTEVRQRLIKSGYVPIPVSGKAPVLEGWQKRVETSQGDLDIWSKLYPDATNTGMLCTHCPTLDIDILDEAAVDAAIALVRDRFCERGKVMLRYGRRPKVAIPFRCEMPFAKKQVLLTAPDGDTEQKIEFLGRGQQVVVHGVHPNTRELYQWSNNGNPGNTKREELPLIDETEAQALVLHITALLLDHGYQRADESKRKSNGKSGSRKKNLDNAANGGDDTRTDWAYLYANILNGHAYHESLRDLGIKLVAAGTNPGAVVNQLRDLMERSMAPHDERWQDRYNDIQRLVDGGVRLLRENEGSERDAPRGEDATEEENTDPVIDPASATDGAAVLNAVRAYLTKFVAYPSKHAAVAHTLWIAHAHLMSAWDSTPRIAFLSPEPASGKSRALEVTEPLVPNAVLASNVSSAYLFRRCGSDEGPPTVLFDEIDTIFGPKAKEHEDIRNFLNSGHRRGVKFGRCVMIGNRAETEDIEGFAAVALAGLGWLPDTILTRSVVIRMRRRLASEPVTPWRHRVHAPVGKELGKRLASWAGTVMGEAEKTHPAMPDGVEDRAADVWEPLLVVADLAGGEWPELAREAATALVGAVGRDAPVSLNLRLLADLRIVFLNELAAVIRAQPEGLATKVILDALCRLEEAPWEKLNKGDPLTASQLAFYIRDYEVKSENIRPDARSRPQAKGYPIAALADAWRRYLPPLHSLEGVTPVTTVTKDAFERFFECLVTVVTPVTGVQEGREAEAAEAAEAPKPVNGDERGLEAHTIQQLAQWYRERFYEERDEEQVDAELRERLVGYGVFTEYINAEFRRVKDAVLTM